MINTCGMSYSRPSPAGSYHDACSRPEVKDVRLHEGLAGLSFRKSAGLQCREPVVDATR